MPERRAGVVVLANSNTVPTSSIAAAALDIALADPAATMTSDRRPGQQGEGVTDLRSLLPLAVCPLAQTLSRSGPDAAAALYHRLAGSRARPIRPRR